MESEIGPKTQLLANVVRKIARDVRDTDPDRENNLIGDAATLLRVLASMVEGKSVYRSFGAPGDFGYGTPIGDALKELYNSGELPRGSF